MAYYVDKYQPTLKGGLSNIYKDKSQFALYIPTYSFLRSSGLAFYL